MLLLILGYAVNNKIQEGNRKMLKISTTLALQKTRTDENTYIVMVCTLDDYKVYNREVSNTSLYRII